MTVVSTKEFNTNQEKYLDLAMNGQVYIQRGDCMFIVTKAQEHEEKDVIFEPDEDFYKSITMEEVRDRLHKVIYKLYAK
jgi:DNA-binding transcriptional regulator YhcF (GntR family)